jgi:deoxycytidine triphosphate deaminase
VAEDYDKKGALLSATEIRERCTDPGAPLMVDYEPENLVGAKYDLRMGTSGLVLPNGRVIKPTEQAYTEDILLDAGETIFVSTREKLRLPLDLVGNMSIKGDLSRRGMLSLTGLIVDPGYDKGDSKDGRLHFRLANLGSRPIVLRPGSTRIASIQFLRLAQQATEPDEPVSTFWDDKDRLTHGLGFLDEIRHVKSEVGDIQTELARQERSLNYVVLGGILVVLVTLLGVSIGGLLSLAADDGLARAADRLIPDERGEKVLVVALILGLVTITACTVVALAYRVGAGVIDLDERTLARQEALREERVIRYRRIAVYGLVTVGLIALAAVTPVGLGAPDWVAPVAAFCILLLAVCLFHRMAWNPIKPGSVRERMTKWQTADEEKAKSTAGA